MARCMKSEKQGHFVFYGAMVSEGIIALIWAAAGCSLYEVTGGLNTGLAAALANGQSAAIYDVCLKTMGGIGTALAMLGVIACPITSGDTAFRSARLVLADWLKLDQKSMKNRLILCIPVLGVGAFLGIGNALRQDRLHHHLALFQLDQSDPRYDRSVGCLHVPLLRKEELLDHRRPRYLHERGLRHLFPAGQRECLGKLINTKTAEGATVYNTAVAYPIGILVAALFLGIFLYTIKKRHTQPHYETLHK